MSSTSCHNLWRSEKTLTTHRFETGRTTEVKWVYDPKTFPSQNHLVRAWFRVRDFPDQTFRRGGLWILKRIVNHIYFERRDRRLKWVSAVNLKGTVLHRKRVSSFCDNSIRQKINFPWNDLLDNKIQNEESPRLECSESWKVRPTEGPTGL